MPNNSKIIKAANEITSHLEFLIPNDFEKVLPPLLELLKGSEITQDLAGTEKEIMILLYRFESTRLWMIDRLYEQETKSVTRGGGETQSETKDTSILEEAAHVYPVWFGTNREPINRDDLSEGFSGDRSEGFGEVFYGRCDVEVPSTHRFGETGRSWWRRWVSFDFNSDDNLKVHKINTAENAENFWQDLRKSFAENDSGTDALVFIHGFNNSFEDAAIRAAQIGFDLKIKGQTAFFSWPSKARTIKYTTDESSIQASEVAITNFLTDFAEKSGAEKIHLMAHSMGNRGLLRALQNITQKIRADNSSFSFGQIILAAPDLDVEVFRQAKDAYISLSESTTIYTSSTDIPIALSRRLHEYPRLGLVPPVTVEEGVSTIKVNNFNLFNLGHGYFSEAGGVLSDIYDLIRIGTPPSDRLRLRERKTRDNKTYWLIDT